MPLYSEISNATKLNSNKEILEKITLIGSFSSLNLPNAFKENLSTLRQGPLFTVCLCLLSVCVCVWCVYSVQQTVSESLGQRVPLCFG